MKTNTSDKFPNVKVTDEISMEFNGDIIVTDLLAFYAPNPELWNELAEKLIYTKDESDEEIEKPIFAGTIYDGEIKILFASFVDSFDKRKAKYYPIENIKGDLHPDCFARVEVESGIIAIASKESFYKFHKLDTNKALDHKLITEISNANGNIELDETLNFEGLVTIINN